MTGFTTFCTSELEGTTREEHINDKDNLRNEDILITEGNFNDNDSLIKENKLFHAISDYLDLS